MILLRGTALINFIVVCIIINLSEMGNCQAFEVCDSPGTGNSCKCSTAPVLCTISELNGFTLQMSTYQHWFDGPTPMCPGGNCASGMV